MPFLSIVRRAEVERRKVTNRFSSGIHRRFTTRFGRKRRFVQPVIFKPIPFFFFAIPRRVYLRPELGFFPVRMQLLGMGMFLLKVKA